MLPLEDRIAQHLSGKSHQLRHTLKPLFRIIRMTGFLPMLLGQLEHKIVANLLFFPHGVDGRKDIGN